MLSVPHPPYPKHTQKWKGLLFFCFLLCLYSLMLGGLSVNVFIEWIITDSVGGIRNKGEKEEKEERGRKKEGSRYWLSLQTKVTG